MRKFVPSVIASDALLYRNQQDSPVFPTESEPVLWSHRAPQFPRKPDLGLKRFGAAGRLLSWSEARLATSILPRRSTTVLDPKK